MRALQLVRGQTLRTLTMVAPTFLAGFIGPTIARALPQVRLRFMELAPAAMRANLGENAFEMALSLGSVTALPTAWTSERVGRLRFGLFASSALAREIGQRTLTPTQVRKRPFIVPLSGATNMPPVDDGCPLGRDRVVMHEAQTILNAMELAAGLDAVVFGPVIAARRFVDAKDLVELDVRGWDVSTDLYLLTSADRVLERTRKSVRDAVSSIPELD